MTAHVSSPATAGRTVLVIGAHGFIGGYVVAALEKRNWRVLRGIRPETSAATGDGPASGERHIDLTCMLEPADWHSVLVGVDAVVNASGILRESGRQSFETIHVSAPLTLARACVDAGVQVFVQISAQGDPQDGAFIATKHRFDALLQQLPLTAIVLRPSVVYARSGSYGGTSLLRALAAFPGFLILPGDGRWKIQPVDAEDLGVICALVAEQRTPGIFEIGGPEAMSLCDYLKTWRRWLRIRGTRALHVPEPIVSLGAWFGERLGRGPVGATMWRMLRRGNSVSESAMSQLQQAIGFSPRALSVVLAEQPSQVQDRWQAQLYFLGPILTASLVIVWLISGLAGWTTSAPEIQALLTGSPMQDLPMVTIARLTGSLDVALALWLASGWRVRWAIALMGASVLAYTAGLGLLAPATWLEPLGGLAKNLIVLPALAVAWVLADRR